MLLSPVTLPKKLKTRQCAEVGCVSDDEENDNDKEKKREIHLLIWNNASWFMSYFHILTHVNRL